MKKDDDDDGNNGDDDDKGGAVPFDPDDPEQRRRFVIALRVAFDDADSIVEDMLAPVRERHFGHAKHRELYDEARRSIVEALDALLATDGGGNRVH